MTYWFLLIFTLRVTLLSNNFFFVKIQVSEGESCFSGRKRKKKSFGMKSCVRWVLLFSSWPLTRKCSQLLVLLYLLFGQCHKWTFFVSVCLIFTNWLFTLKRKSGRVYFTCLPHRFCSSSFTPSCLFPSLFLILPPFSPLHHHLHLLLSLLLLLASQYKSCKG